MGRFTLDMDLLWLTRASQSVCRCGVTGAGMPALHANQSASPEDTWSLSRAGPFSILFFLQTLIEPGKKRCEYFKPSCQPHLSGAEQLSMQRALRNYFILSHLHILPMHGVSLFCLSISNYLCRNLINSSCNVMVAINTTAAA